AEQDAGRNRKRGLLASACLHLPAPRPAETMIADDTTRTAGEVKAFRVGAAVAGRGPRRPRSLTAPRPKPYTVASLRPAPIRGVDRRVAAAPAVQRPQVWRSSSAG